MMMVTMIEVSFTSLRMEIRLRNMIMRMICSCRRSVKETSIINHDDDDGDDDDDNDDEDDRGSFTSL